MVRSDFRLACSCGAVLRAPQQDRASKVRCSRCGRQLDIPGSNETRSKNAATTKWIIAIGALLVVISAFFAVALIVVNGRPQSKGEQIAPSGDGIAKAKVATKLPDIPKPESKSAAKPDGPEPLRFVPPASKPIPMPPPDIRRADLIFTQDPAVTRIETEVARAKEGSIAFRVRRLKSDFGPPRRMRVAVSPALFDDMGQVLRKLEIPFDDYVNSTSLDVSFERLKAYDVVFLNCGPSSDGPSS